MNLVIYVDFEMDKTINNRGNIISIGAIKVEKGLIIDKYKQLISLPKYVDEIDEYTTILTGIRTNDLLDSPCFIPAFLKFMKWAEGCNYVYCWDTSDINSIYYSCQQSKPVKERMRRTSVSEEEKDIKRFTKRYFVDLKPYVSCIDKHTEYIDLRSIYQCICEKKVDLKQLHNPVYDSILLFQVHAAYIQKAKHLHFNFNDSVKEAK